MTTFEEDKKYILKQLEKRSQNTVPLYGVFVDGKPLMVSKRRVYLHPGRAKSELGRGLTILYIGDYPNGRYYHPTKQNIKKAIEELIKDGKLEIKEI